ncbi:MAG TPA: dihydrolipoamide acetyltransferase family protein [Tepidisphaeraceae bacterium]|nr:dihydrolipoamide acetyltransferase family protein [Tepidisphaeraceae bacterium]
MPAEITMPQLSDTMTEGTIVKWNKNEGDKVRAGEEIAEIETDKATMPMEAFEAGTLAMILHKDGEKVPVGGLLAVIATGSEKAEDVKKQYTVDASNATKPPMASTGAGSVAQRSTPAKPSATAGDERVPAPAPGQHPGAVMTFEAASVSEVHEPDGVGHGATRERATPYPPLKGHGGGAGGNAHGDGSGRRIKASPLARRIAADKGIDLSNVHGSGPNGRIVQADVVAFESEPPAKPPVGSEPQDRRQAEESRSLAVSAVPVVAGRITSGDKEIIPLTKIRGVIAQRLQASKQNIPHFYETIDIDVDDLSRLRERLNNQLEREKIRLSLGDLIAKGIAQALVENPALNATFDGKEITRYADVNLGMAVALPDGLIVPVLRGINHMGFREIRLRSADLIDRARSQRLKKEEMTGATFTVSNLGGMGVREFSAIINPPEVGILAVGAAEKRAVVRDDEIVARTMMTVTLSADHRVVDGAVAAAFLGTLRQLLEEPGLMLV